MPAAPLFQHFLISVGHSPRCSILYESYPLLRRVASSGTEQMYTKEDNMAESLAPSHSPTYRCRYEHL